MALILYSAGKVAQAEQDILINVCLILKHLMLAEHIADIAVLPTMLA
ncbi:hypothetical protein [Dictyobacter formicarum]|uniref:Uncharacterized protein n=1 Tax=Dictyobacter formicarum TaxID=2778368 RepID=A0ABQ3VB40_9CHLR|nr:hypothetical protein [Dictyobacter formicarum]GHO83107.1 hypothetical protein KSZ_11130 [Dictyobacter formicarum]